MTVDPSDQENRLTRRRSAAVPSVSSSSAPPRDRLNTWFFMPLNVSLDFWLLDIVARTTHRLTRLDDRGVIATFDITLTGSRSSSTGRGSTPTLC